jgi:ferrous iron transport protein B
MTLADLKTGDEGYIVKVRGRGAFRRRITEMGFVKGKKVVSIKNAPLKDPIEFNILNYSVSLRRKEAELIEIDTYYDHSILDKHLGNGIIDENILKTSAAEKSKEISIAFVGNPNAGKTTIFNYASNSREHVGNYSGVTIDKKTAYFRHEGYKFHITDLPGTYSISAYSPEEIFVRDFIIESMPDVVVNVVDASNLERNLYLTSQLIDMDIKVVLALNMYDELQDKNHSLDYIALGKMLGIPIVPTVGSKGHGITELFDKIIAVYNDQDPTVRHIHINYGPDIEKSIKKLHAKIREDESLEAVDRVSPRFLAIKLLEKDQQTKDRLASASNYREIFELANERIEKLELQHKEDSETLITDAKYGFISGALQETFREGSKMKQDVTKVIDAFATHKLFGFPIFVAFIWIMFQSTFSLGAYPQGWIEMGVEWLARMVSTNFPEGTFKDLIVDGVIGGVGGVIVFLPNIIILFMFISFMEDTGYMARAAFIMDKLMHKIGLHGKSFIPLIMGFGCNVPAIMATRTIENKNNRMLTMLINPFVSCSARLPVHLLLIGTFFSQAKGSMLFLVYFIGIGVAILVALIFNKFLFKDEDVPFVMELPPYRIPTLRTTVRHMWNKASEYLKKMGGVILVASIIIWALGVYPKTLNIQLIMMHILLLFKKTINSHQKKKTTKLKQ